MQPTHPLRKYRERHGLTQGTLAARLGVTKASVSRWEAGLRMPEPDVVRRIAEVTKGEVQPNHLFVAEPAPAPQPEQAA